MSALGDLHPCTTLPHESSHSTRSIPHPHSSKELLRPHRECGPEPQLNWLIGSTFRLQGRIMAIIDFSVSYIVWETNLGLPLTNYKTWGKLFNLPRSQDSIIIVTIIWKIIFVLHSGSTEEKMFLTLTGAPVMPLRDRKASWAESREKTQSEPALQASKHHLCMAPARPVARGSTTQGLWAPLTHPLVLRHASHLKSHIVLVLVSQIWSPGVFTQGSMLGV